MLTRDAAQRMLKLNASRATTGQHQAQRYAVLDVVAKAWWEGGGARLTTFWQVYRVNEFRKGYEKLVVSFPCP